MKTVVKKQYIILIKLSLTYNYKKGKHYEI